jgi:hypothetical protein
MKCTFAKDVFGFYLTPLIGYSNMKGVRAVWVGWFWWLFTIELPKRNVL